MKKVIWFTLSTIMLSGLFCTVSKLPVKANDSVPEQSQTYTVQIPSEISFDSSSDNKSLHISGHVSMNKWFEIDISSSNQSNLVSESETGKIPYTISKDSFYYNPQFIDRNDYDFSEDIGISLNETDLRFAGRYKDALTFTFNPLDTRTIILDCNGGSSNDKTVVKYTVRDGSTYGELPTPVRDGYTFVGWKDAKNNTIYSKSIVQPETERLTALWYRECTTGIGFYVNGALADRLRHIGTADVYVNSELQTKSPEPPYRSWE